MWDSFCNVVILRRYSVAFERANASTGNDGRVARNGKGRYRGGCRGGESRSNGQEPRRNQRGENGWEWLLPVLEPSTGYLSGLCVFGRLRHGEERGDSGVRSLAKRGLHASNRQDGNECRSQR